MKSRGPVLRSARREGGFTLLQLTVALSIGVVLLGIVVLRVDGFSSRQTARASARALGNAIRTFRERAELEGKTYTLTLDLALGRWKVEAEGEVVRAGRIDPQGAMLKAWLAGKEVPSPLLLRLDPRGVLPDLTIAIASPDSEALTLVVGALVNEVDYRESRP